MSGERGSDPEENSFRIENVERVVGRDRAEKVSAAPFDESIYGGSPELRQRLDELRVEHHRLKTQLAASRPEHRGAQEAYSNALEANRARRRTRDAIRDVQDDIAKLEERISTRWDWKFLAWKDQRLMGLVNAIFDTKRDLHPTSWRFTYRKFMESDPLNALRVARGQLEDDQKRMRDLAWVSDELLKQFDRNLEQLSASDPRIEGYRAVSPDVLKSRLSDVDMEIREVEKLFGKNVHSKKASQTTRVRIEDPDATQPDTQEEKPAEAPAKQVKRRMAQGMAPLTRRAEKRQEDE